MASSLRRVGSRLAIAAAALVLAAPAAAATNAQGIDVSHYQGTISWTQVVSADITFAFVKATEGTTITDVTYPVNRAGAAGVGIRVGAYHFARPGGSGDAAIIADAISEADYFLNVAQPQAGELPPVLDLETNGGLKPPDLTTWTSAWLDEVFARTGVRALIYTSPNFWKTSLADTGTVALNGTPLWVAHWTKAAAPLVPGGNWGGQSWTFWQWSSTSHIAGISTAVDADRFRGASAAAAAIPRYPAGPPLASDPPTIVGTAQTGKKLTAVRGDWSGGKPASFAYQWQRCDAAGANCSAIPGATSLTYTEAADDIGHALNVLVTAETLGGFATAVSPATAAVTNAGGAAARPAATASPAIAGTAMIGQTLTTTAGGWTGAPTSYAYQWQRCTGEPTPVCVAIVGAVAASYTLTPDDLNATVKAVVTATGRGGSTSAPSAATAVVVAAPVPPPVPDSLVAAAGAAGAVTTADATATVTWQPGAIPIGSTVTLTHAGAAYTFAVSPALTQLPFPVELTTTTSNTSVGYSLDGKVWLPAPTLATPALAPTQQAGAYVDAQSVTHVLLRVPARLQFFAAGSWGDPTLVAAGVPKPRLVGKLHAVRRRNGVVTVTARVIVPSQANLTVNVPGKTSARRSRLQRPGAVTLAVAVSGRRLPRGARATLRVAARDPYGRTAALVSAFRAP